MKILQVTNFFKPSWEAGGSTRVAYEISKKLVERGHEVTVYTTDGFKSKLNVKKNEPVDVDGIRTYYFRNLSSYLAREMVLPIPYYLPIVARRELRDFDVIHIHEHRMMLAVVIHHYAKKYGVPYILQAHGSVVPYTQKGRRFKNIIGQFFGYGILKDATKLIAVSKAEVEQYKQAGVYEDKIVIIPDGIDIKAFKDLPTYGKFREKYDVKEEHIILFLGRINKRKGIDFLIKSFSELASEMSDVVLVIIGSDDGYKIEMEKLIKTLNLSTRIKLIGYVDEKDKLSAYIDADVLVYPALHEIFGLVPFEAIMCGTPVIVTDDCGCGELVKEANCGYLVKYGDIEGLKEKMEKAIGNPEERSEMVERGRRYIMENLTWDKVVRGVEILYGSVNKSVSMKVVRGCL